MAYPMIALTTDGTAFACASVSLTETGLAVLDEDGSRTGFVPYDSLEYVAPTEESRVREAPMQVLVEDGSSFGAASVSQAVKGVAALDASGSRIGFVPYDTLTHVLPESKTGPTLPADATPLESVNVEEEDDGGGPVWKGDEERAAAEDEVGEAEAEANAEAEAEAEADAEANTDAESETENASEGDTDEGDRDVGTDDDGPVWGGEPEERSERGTEELSTASSSTDAEAEPATEQRTDGSGSGASTPDDEAAGAGEREQEAEESELVVEWSFGDQ